MQNAAAAQDLNEFISFFFVPEIFFVCVPNRELGAGAEHQSLLPSPTRASVTSRA